MKQAKLLPRRLPFLVGLLLLLALSACELDGQEEVAPELITPASQATSRPSPTATALDEPSANLMTVATDAPSRHEGFEDFDRAGNVVGFDPGLMAYLAGQVGFEYEFVVTGYSGMLESVAAGDFDMAIAAITGSERLPEGVVLTEPYLEVGQVLLVRANETDIQGLDGLQAGTPVGVQRFTYGEETAREASGLDQAQLQRFDSTPEAVQSLIDGQVDAVILDSDDALHFATGYPQQLKIVGGEGREGWISTKSYHIALPAEDRGLLAEMNQAIAAARGNGTIGSLTQEWLVAAEPIDAGESLIGTPVDELVIGMVGQVSDLDPARPPDLVGWELLLNTMGGLLMVDAENQLVPILAADFPVISEDKLEATFPLRPGLTFPDGTMMTADDVKYSISRAAQLGNFEINEYLKDEDEDDFADEDAIQVVDPQTVKFVLKEPTSFFSSLVATPPYFVVSEECYQTDPEPALNCGGIGPYVIAEWEPDVHMRLQAYEGWPGPPPAFEKIQIRFYTDPADMRRSLENNAIDIAWNGLAPADILALRDDPAFSYWGGASIFKSYLVFNHDEPPWDDARARQAIAYALGREALAADVFENNRKPLFSPVPDTTPGHIPAEPGRDLEQARSLLASAGYSDSRKLEMTLWFIDDGRYTDLEDEYAAAIKSQLEETGLIEVTLQGAPWEQFRPQSLVCNYPAFLLGWPSPGQPAAFLDAMSWLEYFVTETDSVCSNYESQAMDALIEEAREETNEGERLDLYREIQELWAEELPTLDITQETRPAISLPAVRGIFVDGMGLLHYDLLSKSSR